MSPTHSFESGSAPKKPETLSLAAEKAELLSKLQQLREERKRLEREITEEEEAAKEHAKLAEQPVQETVETEEIEPLEESKSYQETEHTYIDFTDVPGDPKGAAAEAKPRGSALPATCARCASNRATRWNGFSRPRASRLITSISPIRGRRSAITNAG